MLSENFLRDFFQVQKKVPAEWGFSAQIDEDGDLCLEWYKGKSNVVTLCFSKIRSEVNWAALIDGIQHHGRVRQSPTQASGDCDAG